MCQSLEILNRSEPLPFQLDEHVSEEVRLRFRYIDLRREEMRERLAAAASHHAGHAPLSRRGGIHRHRDADALQGDARGRAGLPGAEPHACGQVLCAAAVAADLQATADDRGFRPLLSDRALFPRRGLARRSSARIHPARYRDFILDQAQIQEIMEGLVRFLFTRCSGAELPNPLPRMTYAEAMRRYGSDKPDLRVPLELVDVADLVRGCDFKVFAGPAGGPERAG